MTNWPLFAQETGGAAMLPILLAVLTGVFAIITTLISARAQVMAARIQREGHRRGRPGVASADSGSFDPEATPGARAMSSARGRTLNLLLMACGVMLIGWSGYASIKTRQLEATISDLNGALAAKEGDLEELRKSPPGAKGGTFRPVTVRSEYRPEGQTRSYSLWIEADRETLERIDHVKYVFDDPSWNARAVLSGDEPDVDGRRHFRCDIVSYEAIGFINVLVMYKGYKGSGEIQPIPFRWRAEARPAE
jgi:hypothetical protein